MASVLMEGDSPSGLYSNNPGLDITSSRAYIVRIEGGIYNRFVITNSVKHERRTNNILSRDTVKPNMMHSVADGLTD